MFIGELRDFLWSYWKFLVLLNLVGVAFGYFYYWSDLVSTAWYYWPWVAVSPNACLFMALFVYLYSIDYESSLVDFLGIMAFIGNFKYGLWTIVVVLSDFGGFAAAVSAEYYLFIVFTHFLMFLQSFLVLDYAVFEKHYFVLGVFWFFSNDFLDYTGPMLHSWIPETASVRLAMYSALSLTLASGLVWWLYYKFLDD